MTVPSADQLPAGTPVWIGLLIVLLPTILTLSKTAGKLPGVLGAASRWWQGRQIREVDRSEDLESRIQKAVKRRVDEEVKPFFKRVEILEKRLTETEREVALRDEYLVLAARREANLQEWAASEGLTLPPPPLKRFREWLEERQKN